MEIEINIAVFFMEMLEKKLLYRIIKEIEVYNLKRNCC